ncbi:MAG: phosphohistidine phosphatase SixA [Deltaproteobacteria bacterium]|nr:phosphohistidine phosphatase SixA [Deltaproteobacteria bacterium]
MFLYLVQHGEAKKEEEDPARDLTATGMDDVKRVAEFVGKLTPAPSRVRHSGKTRARRTAEILADAWQVREGIAATDGLAPLDDPAIWAGRLSALSDPLALVGHLPHLARLAALLLCGDREKVVINFKMGGAVCLKRGEEGRWGVDWMIIPEALP